MNEYNKQKKNFDRYVKYSGLAFEMVGIMALGVFVGYKIDQWLSLSFPAFTLSMTVLSVIGAIWHAIRNALK